MRKYLFFLGIALVGAAILVACKPQAQATPVVEKVVETVTVEVPVTKEVQVEVEVTPPPPWEVAHQNIPVSLHETTAGMGYFYSAAQGGMETLTGIPYDELSCKNCHIGTTEDGEVNCEKCHVGHHAPPQFKCLGCHSRQGFEIKAKKPDGTPGMTDVHYSKGMQCINCHTAEQLHGDGQEYNSLHETVNVECTECHTPSQDTKAHQVHMENMDCAACHVRNVINCVNCHFDTELEGGGKVANTKYYNWRFLVKRKSDGKITTGIIMSMVYGDQSFVAVAPFYGHTIGKPDPATICDECHQNPNVAAYEETGQIVVQQWNPDEGKFTFASGVIPFPPDYQDAFVMDFVTRDGDTWNADKTNWTFLKTGVDVWQMLFAEPLDKMPVQMEMPTE
ncbi:MAG: hypothetical protein D6770_01825 [Anaerolineae bacterium]|nr:MAG: hypothetical protein D6770_01825 [Anaerolineae bacterium]